jgi:DNA replication protein DnaC
MNSINQNPNPDLASQLLACGLLATADTVDDFIARATKGRWAPHTLLEELCRSESAHRARRSLESRMRCSRIGRLKSLSDFDWQWPHKIDRQLIERACTLDFIPQARNLLLLGANGVGKTMIAKNIAYLAVQAGHSVLFRTAAEIVEDLQCSTPDLRRRKLKSYARPDLLCIDEVGYLAYDNDAADLLFEIVNRRYERRSLVVTTNKPFKEWNTVFPNTGCIVTLVDRLTHHADISVIEGKSYRLRESELEAAARRNKS